MLCKRGTMEGCFLRTCRLRDESNRNAAEHSLHLCTSVFCKHGTMEGCFLRTCRLRDELNRNALEHSLHLCTSVLCKHGTMEGCFLRTCRLRDEFIQECFRAFIAFMYFCGIAGLLSSSSFIRTDAVNINISVLLSYMKSKRVDLRKCFRATTTSIFFYLFCFCLSWTRCLMT